MKKLAMYVLLSIVALATPLSAYAATVMLDPGHGGADPGAIGVTGLYEKEVNLAISLMVKEELEKKGYRVLMTREDDISLSLQERIEIANQAMPDILVSIHANSFHSPDISGTLVLYYDNRYPVPNYPASEAMARLTPQSRELALSILEEAVKATGMINRGLLESSVYMVRMGSVPSALIETAFLSNYEDEEKLRDEQFRYQMAVGIANGIAKYLPVLFSDTLGHWARESIMHLHELGVVQGNGEYYFPERSLTRAEFIAMMDRSGILDNNPVGEEQENEDDRKEGGPKSHAREDDDLDNGEVLDEEERSANDEDDVDSKRRDLHSDRQSSKDSRKQRHREVTAESRELDGRKQPDESDVGDTFDLQDSKKEQPVSQGKSSRFQQNDRETNNGLDNRQEAADLDSEDGSADFEDNLENHLANEEVDLDDIEEFQFSDLNQDHWAYKSMIKAVKYGIIEGFPDETLRPDAPVTRAQVSVMLDRLISKYTYEEEEQQAKDELESLKQSFSFHDVPEQIWYAEAIYRLYNRNIIIGVGANKFAPERLMSRGEAAALIDRFLSIRGTFRSP